MLGSETAVEVLSAEPGAQVSGRQPPGEVYRTNPTREGHEGDRAVSGEEQELRLLRASP